jgi:hypothetical protein
MQASSASGATFQLGRRPPTSERGSETDQEAALLPSGPSTTITRAFRVRREQERGPMDLREREKSEVIVRRFRMDAIHGFSPSIACNGCQPSMLFSVRQAGAGDRPRAVRHTARRRGRNLASEAREVRGSVRSSRPTVTIDYPKAEVTARFSTVRPQATHCHQHPTELSRPRSRQRGTKGLVTAIALSPTGATSVRATKRAIRPTPAAGRGAADGSVDRCWRWRRRMLVQGTSRSASPNVSPRAGSVGDQPDSRARYDSGSAAMTPYRTSATMRPPVSPSSSPSRRADDSRRT